MIVIVDYGMGNLGSVKNMFKKVGQEAIISSDIEIIKNAKKLLLPGVGSFDNGMKRLKETGLDKILYKKAVVEKTPILGICLGMQLLTKRSEEGVLDGLGFVAAEVKKFCFSQSGLKIPHMGWNIAHENKESKLLVDMPEEKRFYFVHSYYVSCTNKDDVLTSTHYGRDFVSSFESGNILGAQFHPEKSHRFGMQLFKNFVENY
jgi:glutamine amidotransferase